MKGLDIEIGGVTYNVSMEVDDGYVIGVNYVSVYTCDGLISLAMDTEKCEQFYERYVDELNEAYQDNQIVIAESIAEERWEAKEDR